MSLYKNNNGVLTQIAGKGRAEYGASTVRTGTSSIAAGIQAGAVATVEITFTDPMPDADYLVDISFIQVKNLAFSIGRRQKNSFSVIITNTGTVGYFGADTMFKYTAFKLYTDTDYNQFMKNVPGIVLDEIITITQSSTTWTQIAQALATKFNANNKALWDKITNNAQLMFVPDDESENTILYFKLTGKRVPDQYGSQALYFYGANHFYFDEDIYVEYTIVNDTKGYQGCFVKNVMQLDEDKPLTLNYYSDSNSYMLPDGKIYLLS